MTKVVYTLLGEPFNRCDICKSVIMENEEDNIICACDPEHAQELRKMRIRAKAVANIIDEALIESIEENKNG